MTDGGPHPFKTLIARLAAEAEWRFLANPDAGVLVWDRSLSPLLSQTSTPASGLARKRHSASAASRAINVLNGWGPPSVINGPCCLYPGVMSD